MDSSSSSTSSSSSENKLEELLVLQKQVETLLEDVVAARWNKAAALKEKANLAIQFSKSYEAMAKLMQEVENSKLAVAKVKQSLDKSGESCDKANAYLLKVESQKEEAMIKLASLKASLTKATVMDVSSWLGLTAVFGLHGEKVWQGMIRLKNFPADKEQAARDAADGVGIPICDEQESTSQDGGKRKRTDSG